jgi:tetratricopeptide (TPR) repeat protein
VQNYEAGLKAMQAGKFERAKGFLERVVSLSIREMADRAAVHLATCQQQLARSVSAGFKSSEEQYDYAISLINSGGYDEARSQLEKLQKRLPKADYPYYGLAILECLTSHFEPAMKNLAEAIERHPANRFQARNDPDFKNLADDPRFTELLYPEGSGDTPPVTAFRGASGKRRSG